MTTSEINPPQQDAGEFHLTRQLFGSLMTDLFAKARAAQQAALEENPEAKILHVTPAHPDARIKLFRAWFRSDRADILATGWQMSGMEFDVDRFALSVNHWLGEPLRAKAQKLSADSGYTRFPITYAEKSVFRTATVAEASIAVGAVGQWYTWNHMYLLQGDPVTKTTGETLKPRMVDSLRQHWDKYVPVEPTPDTNDSVAAARWYQEIRANNPDTVIAALDARRQPGYIDDSPEVTIVTPKWKTMASCDECATQDAHWAAVAGGSVPPQPL